MKIKELEINKNYKMGSTIYTYRGLLRNKMLFWIRESDEDSPVISNLVLTVIGFENLLGISEYISEEI